MCRRCYRGVYVQRAHYGPGKEEWATLPAGSHDLPMVTPSCDGAYVGWDDCFLSMRDPLHVTTFEVLGAYGLTLGRLRSNGGHGGTVSVHHQCTGVGAGLSTLRWLRAGGIGGRVDRHTVEYASSPGGPPGPSGRRWVVPSLSAWMAGAAGDRPSVARLAP